MKTCCDDDAFLTSQLKEVFCSHHSSSQHKTLVSGEAQQMPGRHKCFPTIQYFSSNIQGLFGERDNSNTQTRN